MSAAMKIEEQIEQAEGKQEGYKPRLVSIEKETQQQKSFEQVCREAAEPLAAIVDHPASPRRLTEQLAEAVMELDFTSEEGEFEKGGSWGEYVRMVLSRVKL